jgi:pilus assembly protein CpaB
MRVITIVSLGASAVLGLGAIFVARTVLPNQAAARPATAAPAQAGVPIVVAAKEIKYGDKLDAGMLSVARVPPQVAPQGAFSTIAQVLAEDKGGAPVALTPIAAREPILPIKLSGPGARPSVAAEISEGMRAYTIKVTDVTGVGGQALPGDHVDVVLMRDVTPAGPSRTYVSDVIVQNVRLLGVDLNADLNSSKPAEPKNATLEVSVTESQKLAIASTLGTLSLALRRTGQADEAPVRALRTGDFLVGGGGGGVAAPHRRASRGASIVTGVITVVAYGGRVAAPAAPPPKDAAASAKPAGA